jgi:general stress protein 26
MSSAELRERFIGFLSLDQESPMNSATSAPKEIDKVWKMMHKIRTCMLVGVDGGKLHGRPMSAFADEAAHAIYFLTDATAAENVAGEHPEVCLSFVEGSRYLSVSGDASVTNDREKIRELWNVFAEAWFDGPEDPTIRLLRVVPQDAQYWETPGKAVTAVSMAIAAATGTHPKAGKEQKVDMH